jgi:hypothetical protein
MNTNPDFGPVIYTYTRKQAIADGEQIDVSITAKEGGIRFPMFITRAVFENYVVVPEGVSGQDEAGRLWDLLWITRMAIKRSLQGANRIPVVLYVRNDNRSAKRVQLVAVCSALDIDDPQPAITLMLETEN